MSGSLTNEQDARLIVLAEQLDTARGYVTYLEDLDRRCKDSDPEAWEKLEELSEYRVEGASEAGQSAADAIVTRAELAGADPELATAMLRIDRFAEPLRSTMITAVKAMLDVLDAAVITSLEAEARDAAAFGGDGTDDA
jgi:hypothetical protein